MFLDVSVELLRLKNLPCLDISGGIDPYVTMRFGSNEKKQSSVYRKSGPSVELEEPKFEWTFETGSDPTLTFKILDRDTFSTDDVFGKCAINILGMENTEWTGWLEIYGINAELRGDLKIRVQLSAHPASFATIPRSFHLLPARIRRNALVGALSGMGSSFDTYEVRLQRVAEIFGDTWQANYDEDHAPMFADDARGMAIRGTLAAEHAVFYRDGSRPTWLRPEGRRTNIAWLGNGSDFIDMLEGGVRNDAPCVYTYAILDTGLYFSKTGLTMSKDIVSKHAVHANGATQVRFSGTFRLVVDPTSGVTILVIDNDSGTYRPNAKFFPLLERLFAINFPGLQVLSLCVLHPQPEVTKTFHGPCEIHVENDRTKRVYPGKWVWDF